MLKAETTYLSGVEQNLEAAKGVHFQGSRWRTVRFDQSEQLRTLMAQHRNYDRRRLKELPHNRAIAVHGYRRTWWFGKRPTGVAMASVLCPLEKLADPDGDPGDPIDLPELMDHVRGLVTDASVPHVVGVCAPSGFTAEALRTRLDLPNVTLVLVQPQEGGGWKVSSPEPNLSATILALFDPEKDSDKIERVREEIERRGAELLTGSMTASSVAARLSLPKTLVADAMQKIAREHPELRVTRESDNVLLYRGAAAATKERTSMSVVDRIRQLFAREGDEAEKINVLTERRAKLAARKDRLYEEIGKLEAKEAELLEQGRATKSAVVRRRLAGQLSQLRKDINRQNTIANMLNKQTDILSTDIHNLTLIEQGKVAELPSTEELTENAVQAEEMLESLSADAELVGSLETEMAEAAITENELAILREFEEADAAQPEQTESTAAAPKKETATQEPEAASPPDPSHPESAPPKRQADAEAS